MPTTLKTLLLFVTFFACSYLYAQNTANNALSFPSSGNGFLGTVKPTANIGVDMYSGAGTVSVPICALPAKMLQIPVSLDYTDCQGVKVQEYASPVGLGWQLNAGGSISRVVRGFPDEQPNGYLGTGQWGQVVYSGSTNPNYTNFFETISTANAEKLTGLSEPNGEPIADGEPDLFNVKTPFFAFQFTFDQFGNAVVSNANGCRVIPSGFVNNSSYQNTSFQVIDDQGNVFSFGNTTNSTETSVDTIFNQVPPNPFITTWYLTQIKAYNSADVITFTYSADPSNDVTYNYSWMEIQTYPNGLGNSANEQHVLSTGKTTVANPKYLTSITSSIGQLNFTYSYNTRQDDPNVPSLSQIAVLGFVPADNIILTQLQDYNFNYGYFNAGAGANLTRLQLQGITVQGLQGSAVTQNLASFGYNTSVNLPDRTQPVFDYWGFCTTVQSPAPSDIFNINRNPDPTMTQADVLTSVTTVTGDTWNLSYGLNQATVNGSTINVGGLRVNQISHTLPSGENLYTTYQYSNGQIYSPNYSTLSVVTTTGSNPCTVYFSGSPYTTTDLNGTFIGYSTVQETNQNGGYTVNTYTNFSDFNDLSQISGSNTSMLLVPTTNLSYKRGLLKTQTVYNANGNKISFLQNTYNAQLSVTNASYGLRVILLPTDVGNGIWNTYGYYSTPQENYFLTQTTRTSYDQVNPANSITAMTNYTYDPMDHRLVQIMSVQDSKGQTYSNTVYRIADINSTAMPIPMLTNADITSIDNMMTANRLNVVIHSVENRNNTINHAHNSYVTSGSNVFLTTQSSYTSDPVNTTTTLVKQQSYTYDANANMISSALLGGKPTSSYYPQDYAFSIPDAQVENASPGEFFYDGFEQDGNFFTAAHTGVVCNTGSYTVPFTMPNSRSYLIQWWSYNGSAWVFNQQPYTNGFTLSGQIDDVRVFPKDALMTSYSYTPGVGKTGEIDPSGQTMTYQYDGLNRLLTVRDQDNNILKEYSYQYQAGVPSSYNTVQSGAFIRNNCSTGLYGSEVTYTVPANTYNASSVPAANQLAQQAVSANGQNYANTNGTCSSTPPCVAPTSVTATANSNQVTVTWNYPPGVGTNAYAVDIYNASGTQVYDDHGTASPLTISSGLAFNTAYTVKVTSLCSGSPVSLPVSVTTGGPVSQAVNLTNLATAPSGFCCHGCQYTTGVYANASTIAPGVSLYTDAGLTVPVSGMTWIFPYNNNPSSYMYAISGNTVVSNPAPVVCQ